MHAPMWTDDHAHLISAAAPPVPEASPRELDRAWARIQADLPGATPPHRRRRTRVLVSAGVAVAAMTVGGVAAAAVWSAHTGRFASDAEDVRLGGPGERLDPSAPDYAKVITDLTRDIPFPTTASREISRQALVDDGRRDPSTPGLVSTGAMRLRTAEASVCAWANDWAAATEAGDVAARARAITVLDGATTWPAVTDVDPKQQITFRRKAVTDEKTGRTVMRTVAVDNTEAGYLPLVRAAAHGQSLDAMGSVLAFWAGNCVPALFPDLPQALDYSAGRPDLPTARD